VVIKPAPVVEPHVKDVVSDMVMVMGEGLTLHPDQPRNTPSDSAGGIAVVVEAVSQGVDEWADLLQRDQAVIVSARAADIKKNTSLENPATNRYVPSVVCR